MGIEALDLDLDQVGNCVMGSVMTAMGWQLMEDRIKKAMEEGSLVNMELM